MDLLGCLIMAQVTTVGGGTIRDLFLNHEQGTGRARARRPQPPMLAARSAAPAARPGFLTARAAAGQGKRAFWISEPEYLAIGQVFGALTFFFWNPIAERLRLSQDDAVFFWWDTIGISAFCCIGAMAGVRAGVPPFVAALCGMFSASFGGLTRDTLASRPVRIMHAPQVGPPPAAPCPPPPPLVLSGHAASLTPY